MSDPVLTTSPTRIGADQPIWRKVLVKIGFVYLFSRLCVVVGAALVAAELKADENTRLANFPLVKWADPQYADKAIPKSALRPIMDVLTSWDGLWYLRIVRDGYPLHVQPHVTYFVEDARAAFFPAYPMLVRLVNHLLPGGDTMAALGVNFVLGAIAIYLVGLIARQLFGVRIAERSMVLMAMFSGSFVLSFAYTEALLIVLAAGCLLCLLKRQWLLAGLLAALGTATRPNGVALVAACAVASFIAIRERREWSSLAAPLLSPMGFIGFQLWIGRRTGESGVWFRVQREAWREGTSFGITAARRSWSALLHPLSSPTNTITMASVFTIVVLLWFLWKHRLPWPIITYCVVVIALMLLPATVTARPRFVYTAFPLLISAAAWFEQSKRDWWPYVIGACAAGLVGLTALYGVLGAIP
ncbi:MAG: glycosyltransferase family 39 protein [Actinomycetota bacterium]